MSSSIEEFGKDVLASVRDKARYERDEEINEAVEDANLKGIKITTAALYEAHVDDAVIINLLQKHWHIDIDDATEVLRLEITVRYPSRALIAYLTSQGLNTNDSKDFMIKNKVWTKLRKNPKLSKLPPAELMDAVKENK